MPRKLKSYQTSIGFFDLAIAAPSMKAAAEAWGTDTDIFKKGFAKLTDDADVVDATMAKPGVVLKRPVGSSSSFSEDPKLPKLPKNDRPSKRQPKPQITSKAKVDDKAAKEAALAFQKEQKRREERRRKEEAAREKRRKRQEQEIIKARRALELAKQKHETKVKAIERDRASVDRRSQAEEARWQKQKDALEITLRRRSRGD